MFLGKIFNNCMGTLTSVKTTEPVVALTFDDGPHPTSTPSVLKILARYDAHATFFMIGAQAEKYPEIVAMVAEAGHTIGVHSFDHPSFSQISTMEMISQLRKSRKVLEPFGTNLFRPPYGHQSISSRLVCYILGFDVVTWSLMAVDWIDHNVDWIVDHICQNIKNGDIILFHDALYRKKSLIDEREILNSALSLILERFSGKINFVTVQKLLSYGNPIRKKWINN